MNRKKWTAFRGLMLVELSKIVGVEMEALPPVMLTARQPKALKLGTLEDLCERFPHADKVALKRWITGWCLSPFYIKRIVYGRNRHDLDGNEVGVITDHERKHARRVMRSPDIKQQKAA